MADCISRDLRAEYRVNQSKEERTKFYEARRAQKGQEVIETRNDKANSSGGQARKGSGGKRKGNFTGQKNSQGQAQKKTASNKKIPTCKKCGKTH